MAQKWEEEPGLVDPKSWYEGFAEGEAKAAAEIARLRAAAEPIIKRLEAVEEISHMKTIKEGAFSVDIELLRALRAACEPAEPEVSPDVKIVRAILHAHQRGLAPTDSGWGDMSYIKGSYDHLPVFKAALKAYRDIKDE